MFFLPPTYRKEPDLCPTWKKQNIPLTFVSVFVVAFSAPKTRSYLTTAVCKYGGGCVLILYFYIRRDERFFAFYRVLYSRAVHIACITNIALNLIRIRMDSNGDGWFLSRRVAQCDVDWFGMRSGWKIREFQILCVSAVYISVRSNVLICRIHI